MFKRLSFVVLILLGLSVTKAQQKPANADLLTRCSRKLIRYAVWDRETNPIRRLELTSPAKGRFYYFPAGHSSDPADPQFREIEIAWNKVKPNIAFYEGPNRPIATTRDETIQQAGESGFVRFLATRDGVEIARLEPSPQEEANFILQKFSAEQVKLFYVLREAARLRERRKLPGRSCARPSPSCWNALLRSKELEALLLIWMSWMQPIGATGRVRRNGGKHLQHGSTH